jgi:HD superfamily phosphodiesterase
MPSRVPCFEPVAALRLLRRCILPEIASMIRYASTPAHGIRHAWEVSHLALLIALLEDQPPIAPSVAAALHDCGRNDDDDDPDHPEISGRIAARILPRLRSASLQGIRASMVVEAVARHAQADRARDEVSAIVRDSDRLALAWERGVFPSCFATTWGMRLAQAGPAAAESAFRKVFQAPLWDTVGLATTRAAG